MNCPHFLDTRNEGPFIAGNALRDVALRPSAAELRGGGRGRASIATPLGIPEETARKRLDVHRSAGTEVPAVTGEGRAVPKASGGVSLSRVPHEPEAT